MTKEMNPKIRKKHKKKFTIVKEQTNPIDLNRLTNYSNLVWSDEFDGNELDLEKWSYETKATGWDRNWNNEWQDYVNDGTGGRNAFVRDSCLFLRAIHHSRKHGTGQYTSARLTTNKDLSWTYGRFTARMKLPAGNGMWPAFWMKGINRAEVGWPRCGEIDIMEMIGGYSGRRRNGGDDKIFGSLHGPNHHGMKSLCRGIKIPANSFHKDFHIFEVNWNQDSISWLLDGIPYHQVIKSPENEWVYDHPFFIIINLAVGGKWPGYPNTTTRFPEDLVIDWVRVYQ